MAIYPLYASGLQKLFANGGDNLKLDVGLLLEKSVNHIDLGHGCKLRLHETVSFDAIPPRKQADKVHYSSLIFYIVSKKSGIAVLQKLGLSERDVDTDNAD